ncbi:MAG TPA: hypothetical protein VLG76_01855 [Rhabdochlamydiaceae bacterium]|nr:hypothetical protein [Rhabdochlamydiaceae bacterium]
MMATVTVHPYIGHEIQKYLHDIAQLRIQVFHEFPYLYEGDLKYEEEYLKKFSKSPEAICVLAFDGQKVVGASTGIPLAAETEETKRAFLEKGLNPDDFFYFSESILLKPYRKLGIGHQFFDYRESHVKNLKRFKYICFCSVARPEDHPSKPADYFPKDKFWEKRGYKKHPELICYFNWKDLGHETETKKPLVFWIKKL